MPQRRVGTRPSRLQQSESAAVKFTTFLPKLSKKASDKKKLLSLAERTRQGQASLEWLAELGAATRARRLAANSVKGKRTALNWVTKFVDYTHISSQILDPLVLGYDECSVRLDAFCTFVSHMIDARNSTGLGLAATVATYANSWLDAHFMLPQPIDLHWLKPQIKDWKQGRTREMVGAFGIIIKNQKAGISRRMMADMFELDWKAAGHLRTDILVLVMKSAAQIAFVIMLRRSEYTLSPAGEFNPKVHMTRSDWHWYRADGSKLEYDQQGKLSYQDLVALSNSLDGWLDIRVKTSKCDIHGNWAANPHPVPLRKSEDGAVIQAANYALQVELADPVLRRDDRENTPMFRDPSKKAHPRTKGQITTKSFDEAIIGLLHGVLKRRGDHRSLAEVRRMYSLHSFRIGGVNYLAAMGVPREIRMILGRWKSDAIDVYSRADIELFKKYLSDQGIDHGEFETLAKDLPHHEGAEGVPYGKQVEVMTENGKAEAKVTPEITAGEAMVEMQALKLLAQLTKPGDPASKRPHSLVGRKVEMLIEPDAKKAADASKGEAMAYVRGVVLRAEPAKDKPFVVKWEDESEESFSITTICDSLIPEQPGPEDDD